MSDLREELKKALCSQIDALSDEELKIITGGSAGIDPGEINKMGFCPICGKRMRLIEVQSHIRSEHKDV